ncbi:MAG: DUF2341 domain-containing protein [Bacteroidetes bacterium]|nr:DUF2341 domain-containing protein [Bacteroidota bacterium]
MKILKKLTTAIILTTLIIASIPVNASTWLSGYSYRKSLSLSRSSGAVTNYQMKVTVYRSAGTDNASSVYVGTKCQSDYDDIRFVRYDGTTLLDYWIESSDASSATVWVEFNSIGTSATTFYMYYGNVSATAVSNGANTFITFDDFERGANGDEVGGAWTELAGSMIISTDHAYGNTRCMKLVGGAMVIPQISVTASNNQAIRFRVWKEDASEINFYHGNGVKRVQTYISADDNLRYETDDAGTVITGATLTVDSWQLLEFRDFTYGGAYTFDWIKNDISILNNGNMSTNSSAQNLAWLYNALSAGNDTYIDNFIVRNWVATEPTWGSWGSEETIPSNWLSGYSYRKSLSLSHPSGAVTNYQMKLTVYRSAGTDNASSVYIDTKCQSDYDDIRFTRSDGATSLDYWIESSDASSAIVWVEYDYIGTGATTFYMYYGNVSATAASNGANTFITFDDFERGANGDEVGGAWTELAGSMIISTDHAYGNTRCMKLVGGAMVIPQISVTASNNQAIRFRVWKEDASEINFYHGNGVKRIQSYISADDYLRYETTDAGAVNTGAMLTVDSWQLLEFRDFTFSGTYTFDWIKNDISILNNGNMLTNSGAQNLAWLYNALSADNDTYIDNFIVRNWVATEPAWGIWGSEGTAPNNWLSGYSYRKLISLSHASGALTNYQMKITVYRSTGTDSESSVYVGTKCQSDYDDIRFFKSDGTTLLDYWIESSDASSATVWVEFDLIGTSATTFYMYYGNASATSVSNGENTFRFFDDFTGAFLNTTTNWNIDAGDIGVSDNHLVLTGTSGTRGIITTKTSFAKPMRMRWKAQMSNTDASYFHFSISNNAITHYDLLYGNGSNMFRTSEAAGGSEYITDNSFNDLTADNTFERTWDTGIIKIYQNGSLKVTSTTYIPTEDNEIYLKEGTVEGNIGYVDWVFAANFQSTEPAWGSWGSEELINGWQYRRKITVDQTKIDADLNDFPFLVSLSGSNFNFSKARSDGYDIRFTSFDGTTLLKYERERHDQTNNLAEYWVKVPYVSGTVNTYIYMYYGKSDATDGADPSNVWDANFKAVYHLKDSTTSIIKNSTGNNNHGTKGSANNPLEADAKIAKGQDFSSDNIDVGSNLKFNGSKVLTVEAWANPNSFPARVGNYGTNLGIVYHADGIGGTEGYRFFAHSDDSKIYFCPSWYVGAASSQVCPIGEWHYWTGTFDADLASDQVKLYKDGTLDGTATRNSALVESSTNVFIGRGGDGPNYEYNYWDGKLDEIRISQTARSAAWIKATYYSGNNTLLTFGSEEQAPSWGKFFLMF